MARPPSTALCQCVFFSLETHCTQLFTSWSSILLNFQHFFLLDLIVMWLIFFPPNQFIGSYPFIEQLLTYVQNILSTCDICLQNILFPWVPFCQHAPQTHFFLHNPPPFPAICRKEFFTLVKMRTRSSGFTTWELPLKLPSCPCFLNSTYE